MKNQNLDPKRAVLGQKSNKNDPKYLFKLAYVSYYG